MGAYENPGKINISDTSAGLRQLQATVQGTLNKIGKDKAIAFKKAEKEKEKDDRDDYLADEAYFKYNKSYKNDKGIGMSDALIAQGREAIDTIKRLNGVKNRSSDQNRALIEAQYFIKDGAAKKIANIVALRQDYTNGTMSEANPLYSTIKGIMTRGGEITMDISGNYYTSYLDENNETQKFTISAEQMDKYHNTTQAEIQDMGMGDEEAINTLVDSTGNLLPRWMEASDITITKKTK